MPTYDYRCAACGHRFELAHGVHGAGPDACPSCGVGPVTKAITAPAVHFKGSGWAKKERRASTASGSRSGGGAADDHGGASNDKIGQRDDAGGTSNDNGGKRDESGKRDDKERKAPSSDAPVSAIESTSAATTRRSNATSSGTTGASGADGS